MRITRIEVSGVRSYGENVRRVSLNFADQPILPRWIVVAGRNGAGKSTFLQAIALAIAGPSAARSLMDSFAGWIKLGSDTARCAVQLKVSEEADAYKGGGRYPKFDPWVGLEWKSLDEEGPEPSLSEYRRGGAWTPSRGPWAENPPGWFLAGYGPFRRLSLAPAEVHRTMMTRGRPASLASLFREEATLSESVHWIKELYLRRLEGDALARTQEELILRLLNDGLLPEGAAVTRVSSEGLWVKMIESPELPLSALSDGYRTVAALVLDIIKQISETQGNISIDNEDPRPIVTNEGIVLIDEIDVHLHVSWQQRIGFWLKDHFPNIQFIVTTHSPFICQAADPGGLVRLPAPGEERSAEIVTGPRYASVVNGSADEAVLTDLFGLDSAVSDEATAMRRKAAELERLIASGGGSESDNELLSLLQQQLPHNISAEAIAALAELNRRLS